MANAGLVFDILLTDMVMPRGMNGAALADAIAARWPDVRVILSTGYADKTIAPPERAQHWSLLQKPYSSNQLFAALRAAMLRSP